MMMTGMVARRLVPYIKVGDVVEQGERIGMIVLGSRVDIHVGQEWDICVRRGERLKAGVSVVATLNKDN